MQHRARRNNNRVFLVCAVLFILVCILHMFGFTKSAVDDKHHHGSAGVIVRHLDQQLVERVGHGPESSIVRKRVLLKPHELPHLLGFSQAVIPPQGEVAWQVHATKYEVFTVMSGVGVFSVADSPNADPSSGDNNAISHDTVMGEGVTITVRPRYYHAMKNTGEDDLVLMYFGIAEE
mmetsp:Transcript_75561/g.127071  ORF Transcript_75561/g.127071 Transcript_75561/m.127071 type:complete len:177 (-) Transcript_75561:21-551(-)